jgi:hypothetical protein
MDVSIEENKRQHAALGNVDFLVADVTEMEQVCGVVQRTLVGFQGVVCVPWQAPQRGSRGAGRLRRSMLRFRGAGRLRRSALKFMAQA